MRAAKPHKRLQSLALLASVAIHSFGSLHAEPVPIPELKAHVYDGIDLLDAQTEANLNEKLQKLEQDKGSQIAVIIIATTGEESIEEFGIRAGERLKIGRKGVDDGLILIVARDDRKVRIEVGYGLEGAIPDAVANRIIQERIVPAFRAGNFDTGIEDAVNTLDKIIRGEALPVPAQQAEEELVVFSVFSIIGSVFFLIGVAVPLIVGRWLSITNFIVSAAIGGLAFYFTGVWAFGLFAAGILAFFIGIFGTVFSAAGKGGSGSGGSYGHSSYSSSSYSSSSSGFSSGSSFSGGGGSFGGGGASGSW